jgi:uncharacterized protein
MVRRQSEKGMAMAEKCIAFNGQVCVASGSLAEVAAQTRLALDADPETTILILDAETSEVVEVDLRGTVDDVLARVATLAAGAAPGAGEGGAAEGVRSPGRPKLGVVAREITLLPRHWEWLGEQPGGASVTLRKLVDEARKSTAGETEVRRAREACYRFMNTVAGDEPGFEEALRALYAGDAARFETLTEVWPVDVRGHARHLAAKGFC